jgi:hypothetical protein
MKFNIIRKKVRPEDAIDSIIEGIKQKAVKRMDVANEIAYCNLLIIKKGTVELKQESVDSMMMSSNKEREN